MVERVFPVLPALVGSGFALDPANGHLTVGGAGLNDNFDAVDRFKAQTGGVATVFARQGSGFRRVATSLKKQDGSRALGTMLDPQGRAFAAVSAGQPFSGRATLFGKPYMTHYELVRDADKQVVGVLFVGFEIATAEELSAQAGRLQDLMRLFRLGTDAGAAAARPKVRMPAAAASSALRFGHGEPQSCDTAAAPGRQG